MRNDVKTVKFYHMFVLILCFFVVYTVNDNSYANREKIHVVVISRIICVWIRSCSIWKIKKKQQYVHENWKMLFSPVNFNWQTVIKKIVFYVLSNYKLDEWFKMSMLSHTCVIYELNRSRNMDESVIFNVNWNFVLHKNDCM